MMFAWFETSPTRDLGVWDMTRITSLQVLFAVLTLLLQHVCAQRTSPPAASREAVYSFKLRGYSKSNATDAQALLFENYYLTIAPVVANGITNDPVLRLTSDPSKALQFATVVKRNGQPGLEVIPLPKKRNGPQLALVGKYPVQYFSLVDDPRRAERRIGRAVLYQDWWSKSVEGQRVLIYKGIENGVVMMNGFGAEDALLNWVDASQSASTSGTKVLYEVILEEKSTIRTAVRQERRWK